jgi:AbrB family looped-hinge helix DNA binding protein
MRITSKGQVTIPKHIREKLLILPGDDIGFREEGQAVIVEKVEELKKVNAGIELARHLRELGHKLNRSQYTSEELMEMTRGPFNDLDAD